MSAEDKKIASKKRAIVVDCDERNVELMGAVLTRHGFSVGTHLFAELAVAECLDEDVALFVCGEGVDDIDGAEASRQIKSSGCATRVLLLVDPADDLEVENAAQRQQASLCDAVIERPFRFHRIQPLLQDWGMLPSGTEVAGTSDVPVGPAPVPVPELPSSNLDILPPAATDDATPTPMALPLPIPEKAPEPTTFASAPPPAHTKPPPAATPPPAAKKADVEVTAGAPPAVRKPAPSTNELPPGIVPTGDLQQLPLPRLLFELYVATFSGILHLQRRNLQRRIFFWGGFPVGVETPQLSDDLTRELLDQGRIDEEQAASVRQLVEESGLSQGEALVSSGVLPKSQLDEVLLEQCERQVLSAFGWRDGTYSLEPNSLDEKPSETLRLRVNPVRAVWQGVHQHHDPETLRASFAPSQERLVVATALFGVHRKALGALLEQGLTLSLLDGQTPVQRFVSPEQPANLVQALYALVCMDMVQLVPAPSSDPDPTPEPAPSSEKAISVEEEGDAMMPPDVHEGIARLQAGDTAGARQYLAQAIALHPEEPSYHLAMARVVMAEGDQETAPAWRLAGVEVQRALHLDPTNLEANLAMAELLYNTEHFMSIRPYLVRVLQVQPNHARAQQMLARLDSA